MQNRNRILNLVKLEGIKQIEQFAVLLGFGQFDVVLLF